MTEQIDKRAFDFVLPDLAGHEYRLDDYAGSWFLLVFHRHLA